MSELLVPIIASMIDPLVITGGIASGWLWGRSKRNGAIALCVSIVILLIVDISSTTMLGGHLTPRVFSLMLIHCAALGIWMGIAFAFAKWRARVASSSSNPPSPR
jgi:hypothetical protein